MDTETNRIDLSRAEKATTGTTRRGFLAGAGGAGATTFGLWALNAQTAEAAGTLGPWYYVAPGESIQSAISTGAKAILLGAGTYPVAAPITVPSGVQVSGVGQSTRVLATATMAAVFRIGNGAAADGVQLQGLVVDCDAKAAIGIHLNIVGTSTNYQGEPDAVCRLDNLWVYDPTQDGIVYAGSDTQATTTTRVRVRRAARHGFNIGSPDNWFSQCEATTSGNTGAGFLVASSNLFLSECKAWYCRGYGFHVTGIRNKLIGCEAQDIASHGFYLVNGKNVVNGCVADSCSALAVGGGAAGADGFYVTWDDGLSLVGCQAFDRKPEGTAPRQRYGFNVPKAMVTAGRVVAPTGWDNVSGLVNQRT